MIETPYERLKLEVIDSGLCTRCGTCVGVCPEGSLEFTDPLGECLPSANNTDACSTCPGWCYSGCPGAAVHFPTLNDHLYGEQPNNPLLGQYSKLYVGHATDETVRQTGASGGIISSLAIYLLEHDLVDGVIGLAPTDGEPWKFKPIIARTRDEVLECAQSKYSISPVNTILQILSKEPDTARFAYVGIPCGVHSIRKLQLEKHPGAQKIQYILGSYCGNILHFDAVRSFLSRYGVKDYRQISKLQYREGEWPGNLSIELENGKTLRIPKFYANYLIPFHMMRRCLTCIDLTNEFADISGGDAWAPVYEERGKGFSLIMGRTQKGQALIDHAIADGLLAMQPIEEKEVVHMHSHMLDFKKRGAFLRIDRLRSAGKPFPKYGHTLISPISSKRRSIERIIQVLYWICSKQVSVWLINHIPMKLIGPVLNKVRNIWKNSAKPTENQGLSDLVFRLEPPALSNHGTSKAPLEP